MSRPPLLIALSTCAVALAACGGGSSSKAATSPAPASTATTAKAGGPCRHVAAPAAKSGQVARPRGTLAKGKAWTAAVTTNCGAFTITLDTRHAPRTAASFASLARHGFYDGLTIHRIVPGFVIQGGDPRGDGTGGPGYSVTEAPPAGTRYTKGSVAMAKTQTEAPGTSGSQFYIVLGADAGLPPEYAIVGKVTSGMDVVDRIGTLPLQSSDPQGAPPRDTVVMEKVTIAGS